MQLRYAVRGAIWVILYLLFILAPLFALLAGSLPPTRDFWTEFSVAIGYCGPGDDGPAVRPHRALPVRHRAVGRGRHLSLSPSDLADRGRAGRRAPDHPVHRPAGIARAAQLHPGAVARPLRRAVDLLADRAGGDGAVAREAEDPLRDVAPHPHRARGRRRRGRAPAHGGVELLPDRPLEAGAVDRPDDLLDRAAALRAHRQAAVHAPPAVPRRRKCARSAATPGRW